jgi:hypothetical protein
LAALAEPVQRQVAGGDLVPGRRDADLRLVPVVVGHADARSIARAGARWSPSVTSVLRGFLLCVVTRQG